VAARLSQRHLDGVEVIVRTGDMLALVEDWRGAEVVVLIDAAASMSQPGCVHRIDLACAALPRGVTISSTHAFGIPEAIDLARVVGALPRRFIVYAVEGACFDHGVAMTAVVAAAADRVADLASGDLRQSPHQSTD
jgi:hydrogenase maturation protease